MNFPEDIKYTKDHEWIKLTEDNIAMIGITEFAQQELGDIVYVDINSVGQELNADEVFGTVEAVKTVSDLFLPLAGKVLEVNAQLESNPELVNKDPYNEGWMIKLELKNPEELDNLLSAEKYKELVG